MTAKSWFKHAPGLVMGLGIVLASLIAAVGGRSAGAVMAALLLLALAVLGSDALLARHGRNSLRPSWAALILAGTCVLFGLILDDPRQTAEQLPLLGAVVWAALLSGSRRCVPFMPAKPH